MLRKYYIYTTVIFDSTVRNENNEGVTIIVSIFIYDDDYN